MIRVRTSTIPTWTEALTFPNKQVMLATGAGAMAQELVMPEGEKTSEAVGDFLVPEVDHPKSPVAFRLQLPSITRNV